MIIHSENHYPNIPLVKLFLFYIIGITCSIYVSSIYFVLFFALVLSITIGFAIKAKYNSNILLQRNFDSKLLIFGFISFLLLGYVNAYFFKTINYKTHFNTNNALITQTKIKLLQTPTERENSFKAEADILQVNSNAHIKSYTGKFLCYFEKDSSISFLKKGDILYVNAKLTEIDIARNPNEFNYKEYLSYRNISHQMYVPLKNWVLVKANKNFITLLLFKTKRKLQHIINQNIYDDDERAVASALLLGNRNMLSDEILQSFSSTGATHILAVSGLHVGIFYGIISFSFLWLKRIKKLRLLHPIIIILSIWFYVALTGGSPSVVRAATMFSFIAIGFALNRHINIYNIIAFSAFIITSFNPFIITDVGFQLSYFAVTGIIFMYDKIYTLLYVKNYFLDKVWSITSVSLAAQIATFPLIVLYFHQFPNLFWISNLVVIPAASLILYGGIIMFALSWNETLLYYSGKILSFFIKLLNQSLELIEKVPYALSSKLYITHFQAILFYIVIFLMLMAFSYKNKLLLKYALVSCIILVFTFSLNFTNRKKQTALIVYHVPKHSAIEIIDGNKAYSLFDTAFLKNQNLLNFRVEHNWWENQIREHHFDFKLLKQTKVNGNTIYQIKNKKLMIVDDIYNDLNHEITVDYVIIRNKKNLKLAKLSQQIKADIYIFDTSNSHYKEKYWKQDCDSLGLNCYFVSDSIAFQNKL